MKKFFNSQKCIEASMLFVSKLLMSLNVNKIVRSQAIFRY